MKSRLTKNQLNGSITLNPRGRWEPRFRLWGQLCYNERVELGTKSTFTSIVWRDGDLRASVMLPYLCYGGDPTYIQLSGMDTARILWIAVKTIARHVWYWSIPKALWAAKTSAINIIATPYRAILARKSKSEADKKWEEMFLEFKK